VSHIQRGRRISPSQRDGRVRARPAGFRDLRLDKSRDRARCTCLPLVGFGSFGGLKGSDDDPNCGLCDRRVSVGPLGLHKPLMIPFSAALVGHIGSGFWCCHWSSGGWGAGSRPWSSDRRGNRDSWRSCEYTSAATGHLLWLLSLRKSGLWVSGLRAAGLWIPRLLGTARLPRLFRSIGLWLPKPPAVLSLLRFRLWIPRGWLSRRSTFGGLVDWSRVRYRAC
jgi:hypothetical protein